MILNFILFNCYFGLIFTVNEKFESFSNVPQKLDLSIKQYVNKTYDILNTIFTCEFKNKPLLTRMVLGSRIDPSLGNLYIPTACYNKDTNRYINFSHYKCAFNYTTRVNFPVVDFKFTIWVLECIYDGDIYAVEIQTLNTNYTLYKNIIGFNNLSIIQLFFSSQAIYCSSANISVNMRWYRITGNLPATIHNNKIYVPAYNVNCDDVVTDWFIVTCIDQAITNPDAIINDTSLTTTTISYSNCPTVSYMTFDPYLFDGPIKVLTYNDKVDVTQMISCIFTSTQYLTMLISSNILPYTLKSDKANANFDTIATVDTSTSRFYQDNYKCHLKMFATPNFNPEDFKGFTRDIYNTNLNVINSFEMKLTYNGTQINTSTPEIISLSYGVPIKCIEQREPLVTGAFPVTINEMPYSKLIYNSKLFESELRKPLILEKTLDIKDDRYFVYCRPFARYNLYTPRAFVFYEFPSVTIQLFSHPASDFYYAFDGYVYQCTGNEAVNALRLECESGCDFVDNSHCHSPEECFAVIHDVYQRTQIIIRCKGFRTPYDKYPVWKDAFLDAYPSIPIKQPQIISMGMKLSCLRYYDSMQKEYYQDIELVALVENYETRYRSNVKADVKSVVIPATSSLKYFYKYCCLNTIDNKGNFICENDVYISLQVSRNLYASYSPFTIDENVINYYPSDQIIFCQICSISKTCTYKTILYLTSSDFKYDVIFSDISSIKIPPARYFTTDNPLIILTCGLKDMNVSVVLIRYPICSKMSITIIPAEQMIFRVGDVLECNSDDITCQDILAFRLRVYTNGGLTTDVSDNAQNLTLTEQHQGQNFMICSYRDQSDNTISANKSFWVYSVNKIEITGLKKSFLRPGDDIKCISHGYPASEIAWFYIEGPSYIPPFLEKLSIRPTTLSGKYSYECISYNLDNAISTKINFIVRNNYLIDIESSGTDMNRYFIYFITVTLLFLILNFIMVIYVYWEHIAVMFYIYKP